MQPIFVKNEYIRVDMLNSYKYQLVLDVKVNIDPKEYGYHGDGVITVVPSGFISDGYSVPRLFWSIFPPMGKDDKCAITHDYLYALGLFNRKTCDKIFLEAMRQEGVSKWKRHIKYWMVRIFGNSSYNK